MSDTRQFVGTQTRRPEWGQKFSGASGHCSQIVDARSVARGFAKCSPIHHPHVITAVLDVSCNFTCLENRKADGYNYACTIPQNDNGQCVITSGVTVHDHNVLLERVPDALPEPIGLRVVDHLSLAVVVQDVLDIRIRTVIPVRFRGTVNAFFPRTVYAILMQRLVFLVVH